MTESCRASLHADISTLARMSTAAEASPTSAVATTAATSNGAPAALTREPSQQDLEIARQLQNFQSQGVPQSQATSQSEEIVRDALSGSVDEASGRARPAEMNDMRESLQPLQQTQHMSPQFTPMPQMHVQMQPPPTQPGPSHTTPAPSSGGGQQCR